MEEIMRRDIENLLSYNYHQHLNGPHLDRLKTMMITINLDQVLYTLYNNE